MTSSSEVLGAAGKATAAIGKCLKVGSPADQMEALMRAFRLSPDREAFALALVGEIVGLARRCERSAQS